MNVLRRGTAAGVALVSALVVCAVVVAVALSIAALQSQEIAQLGALMDRAAAARVETELEGRAIGALLDDARHSGFDAPDEAWAALTLTAMNGSAHGSARLSDLQGRLNLNNLARERHSAGAGARHARSSSSHRPGIPARSASRESGTTGLAADVPAWAVAEQQLRRLLETLDIDTRLVAALADWLDADAETRYPNGAEDAWYLGRARPYRAANRPLVSLSELHLVRGFTPVIIERISPFVSVLPGHEPVNVNAAPPEVLMSLGTAIDRGVAEQLTAARRAQPFLSAQAFVSHPVLSGRSLFATNVVVTSKYFALSSTMTTRLATLRTRSIIHRVSSAHAVVIRRERGAG